MLNFLKDIYIAIKNSPIMLNLYLIITERIKEKIIFKDVYICLYIQPEFDKALILRDNFLSKDKYYDDTIKSL
jgi:hypothetical protein